MPCPPVIRLRRSKLGTSRVHLRPYPFAGGPPARLLASAFGLCVGAAAVSLDGRQPPPHGPLSYLEREKTREQHRCRS